MPFVNPYPDVTTDPDKKILVVDNYQLSMFQTCPSKYDLRMNHKWTTRRQGAALGFGQLLHLGLEVWYASHDIEAAIQMIKDNWPPNHPPDDFRNMEKCISVMREYVQCYPSELFRVVGHGTDQPMLEVNFTLPLLGADGSHLQTFDGHKIYYGGIFDMLMDFNGQLYVVDHKTTTQLGDYYFEQYKPNNQITGYIWGAGHLTDRRVGGAMINAIGLMKKSPTKFKRHYTVRSPEDIADWVVSVQHVCNLLRIAHNTGEWPKFTSACTLYGRCEFHSVHVLSGADHQQRYLETMFTQETWDHETRGGAVDLAKYNSTEEV